MSVTPLQNNAGGTWEADFLELPELFGRLPISDAEAAMIELVALLTDVHRKQYLNELFYSAPWMYCAIEARLSATSVSSVVLLGSVNHRKQIISVIPGSVVGDCKQIKIIICSARTRASCPQVSTANGIRPSRSPSSPTSLRRSKRLTG